MRIGIISDIHGNYPALKAVIEDAKKNNVDSFIFAGDYIFDMPYSNEVTELLRSIENIFIIQGNKEGYLHKLAKEDQADWIYDQMGALYQTYKELTPENISYLSSLKPYCYVNLPYSGRIYVTHIIPGLLVTPKKTECSSSKFREEMEKNAFTHNDFLQRANLFLNENKTKEVFSSIDASVIIFGHSHLQWHGYCGNRLIINPGSCGQPLDYNTNSSYTILEDSETGLSVEERRACYNIEETIKHAKNTAICQKGKVWCKLVFSALRTAKDEFSVFFRLAEKLASEKNESGQYFSNETWNQAAKIFWNED